MVMATSTEHIQILPTTLLTTHATRAEEFRALSRELHIELGWHYLLDLIWAAEQIGPDSTQGATVLDAGAGTGLMQWWLAERGATVISIDREPRLVSRRLRARYDLQGLRDSDHVPIRTAALSTLRRFRSPRSVASACRDFALGEPRSDGIGVVRLHEADLDDLKEIESNSIDTVVSISSLEHNSPEHLPVIVAELMRVIRPGGRLVATLGAAKDVDWYHRPSQGWCYTESTLRDAFGLSDDCDSNYDQYDDLFQDLRECAPLRDQLADFYRHSGDNGMPWGVWDPQYQTVGVTKVKE